MELIPAKNGDVADGRSVVNEVAGYFLGGQVFGKGGHVGKEYQ